MSDERNDNITNPEESDRSNISGYVDELIGDFSLTQTEELASSDSIDDIYNDTMSVIDGGEETEKTEEAEKTAPSSNKKGEINSLIEQIQNEIDADTQNRIASMISKKHGEENTSSENEENEEEKENNDRIKSAFAADYESFMSVEEMEEEQKNAEKEYEESKKAGIVEIIRKIVFAVSVLVFVVAGILLIKNLRDSDEAVQIAETNASIIATTVSSYIDENGEIVTVTASEEEEKEHNFSVMEYYKNINPDVIGYIEIDGCSIYEPVVQTTDNNYYLTHTYYNGVNQAGAIFMDYRCNVSDNYTSPNLVLYGHNQQDLTMFGALKDYKNNVDFYEDNPLITFNTEYEVGKYVIFGYFVTNTLARQDKDGEVFHYHDYIETLNDESTFKWYMYQIKRRNQIISPVDVVYGDKLLVLSTCSNEYNDSRFVVFARKLRSDESIDDFDFSSAKMNPNAKGIDWKAVNGVQTRPNNGNRSTVTQATTMTTTSTTTVTTVPVTEATTKKTKATTTVPETEATTKKTKTTTETTTATTTSATTTTTTTTTVTETETSEETTTSATKYTGPTGPSGPTGTTGAIETEPPATEAPVTEPPAPTEPVVTEVVTPQNEPTE